MLINVSNHPFETWTNEQKEAAETAYTYVLDVPFPPIPPSASKYEVMDLAVECWGHICKISGIDAVHIMGELVFCYILVGICHDHGVQCIASTTARDVEVVDGRKVSTFRFVKFREY
jgi:hypothetical protein